MKRHKKAGRYEVKTVQWTGAKNPSYASLKFPKTESFYREERMEKPSKRHMNKDSEMYASLRIPRTESFVPGQRYEKTEKMHARKYPSTDVPRTEPFTREQFEEEGKELEKTDRVTGLWYPHKSK